MSRGALKVGWGGGCDSTHPTTPILPLEASRIVAASIKYAVFKILTNTHTNMQILSDIYLIMSPALSAILTLEAKTRTTAGAVAAIFLL